jgi:hypothetical protein
MFKVFGRAHGELFFETGFETLEAAQDYASSIIDGDVDSDVQIASH